MAEPNRWLSRVRITGFRSLADVDFDLGPARVNVLIGPNGAGKSNLLQFLRMIALLRTQSLGLFVGREGGASTLFHYGPQQTKAIECELEFTVEGHGASRYRATWQMASGDRLVFADEEVGFRKEGQGRWKTMSLGGGHLESDVSKLAKTRGDRLARHLNLCLKGLSFFHFHDTSITSPLRGNARIADASYLRSDGSNLAAYLYALCHSEDEEDRVAWRRIGSLLRQVAPFVKELKPTPVSLSGTPQALETSESGLVRLHWIDERDARFGPEHMSDGTLRFLALVTALTMPSHRMPRFVSIDEPELGLHPAALSLLVDLVRSVSSHTQVLLATQSPALLNLFAPDEIAVCERADGKSTIRRLDRTGLDEWLKDYSLAELFDKGVLGGRP
ncbi:MAG TPA: AAA family ATPase [Planctomycetota bacterium]